MSGVGDAIKKAATRGLQIYIKLCTVDSVDETARTINCTPLDGTAQLADVNLQSITEKNNGLLISPTVGSHVAVGFFDKNNAVVLMYSEIEKILLDVDDIIVINGGKNDGLVKIKELTGKLNELKDTVNELVKQYNEHIHTTTATIGAGTSVGVISPTKSSAGQAKAFTESDYENENIKH